MRKRRTYTARPKLGSNTRRRLMLKRLHQKVIQRRKQFQQSTMLEEIAEAC
ncbi:hypothetical protein OE749_12590 [Aestuariibacter sp. AA17]|uniref:Uncharacterized protein n=1 Tax=Fluctibacter corallii TaxID=2984329 RepID=A0ABT3AAA1_9ALTE|nr:hypothetical protein [Aestuariibacter sp. AA17]MCV2885534.1 hypothetical protein [Aestuariibacter sp. AA17]